MCFLVGWRQHHGRRLVRHRRTLFLSQHKHLQHLPRTFCLRVFVQEKSTKLHQPDQCVLPIFSNWIPHSVFFPYTNRNRPSCQMHKKDIPGLVLSPTHFQLEPFRTSFLHRNPSRQCPCNFLSQAATGSSTLCQVFGHVRRGCVGRVRADVHGWHADGCAQVSMRLEPRTTVHTSEQTERNNSAEER